MSLTDLLEDLRSIVEPGTPGTTRRFPSPEYLRGRVWIREAMEAAGLHTSIDAAGNLFGRREGTVPGLAPVMIGSHSDTVHGGGHLDGALGVMAALEASKTLPALRHPLVVADYLAEEANDFGISCVGSRALAGTFLPEWLERRAHGQTLGQAIAAAGGSPSIISTARLAPGSLHGALELHIEQGPVLESAGRSLGVVSGIVGITRGSFELVGRADHSGTAPMELRRDALAAAAALILALEQLCLAEDGAVGTVGRLEVRPNQSNVVPGSVSLIAEIRHLDASILEGLWQRFFSFAQTECERRGIGLEVASLTRTPPSSPPEWLLDLLVEAARSVDPEARVMPSGAGHDTGHLSHLGAAMLFVPSVGGRSHCPEEETTVEHLQAGLEALKAAVLALDKV